jgi:1,4-dihydroxy-6-naphthoate synthase
MQTIRFGHSPDPDDAFMFYAIAKRKIDLNGFDIRHVIEDIESLNQRALRGELEASAVSVHAYAYVADQYAIMKSGASVGEKYGPIVVSQKPAALKDLIGKTIAIPGALTTANLVLKLALEKFSYVLVPFDKILDYVSRGKADAGLVIHEGQITYQDRKLHKVIDLGEWWWEKTKLPLPLGVDAVRKDLGPGKMAAVSKLFRESILYSLDHRSEALEYALPFGRGISRETEDRFVAMYVNEYTKDLGEKGEDSIRELLARSYARKLLTRKIAPEFV